jgi:hypothetical protein
MRACDRCLHKIVDRPDGADPTEILFLPAGERDHPEYELCVTCTQEFREWITTPPSTPDDRKRSPVRAHPRARVKEPDLPAPPPRNP